MAFIKMKRTLGFKIEGTPYTAETLAASDYDVPAFNIGYDKEIEMYVRHIATGKFSKQPSIPGKRSITITFSIDVADSGTAATAPTWFKCGRACSMVQTTYGSTGVGLATVCSGTKTPATIEVVDRDEGASPVQVVTKARGCMGNLQVVIGAVGQPVRIDFTFTGVLVSVSDRAYGSIITPTGFDTVQPAAVLSTALTMFGRAQVFNGTTVDLGNEVVLFPDSSYAEGFEGAHVVDRTPTMTVDPDLKTIAADPKYAAWTAGTTGAMSLDIGSLLHFSAPAIQYSKQTDGDREGHVVSNDTATLLGSAGDDEFEILQGAKA